MFFYLILLFVLIILIKILSNLLDFSTNQHLALLIFSIFYKYSVILISDVFNIIFFYYLCG